MDISPCIINWIRNFRTTGEQRVRIGSCMSEWQKINGGVPQGIVLGPTLFLVMINSKTGKTIGSMLTIVPQQKALDQTV